MEAATGSNHEQREPSVLAQGQCQSQTFVSSPTVEKEKIEAASHELTLSVTDPNTPVDIINSISSVLNEVATAGSNLQQCEPSVQAQAQCCSQTFVLSPTVENENIEAVSHEFTLSVTHRNAPVYTINSVCSVPVEVASDELQQRQCSDCGIPATPSNHKEAWVSVEVASEELQQRQCSSSGIQATPSDHKEISVPVVVASDELQLRECSDSGIQATPSNHKETGAPAKVASDELLQRLCSDDGIQATPSDHKEASVPVEVTSDELQQGQCSDGSIEAIPFYHMETSLPVEVASDKLQQIQCSDSDIQATPTDHKEHSVPLEVASNELQQRWYSDSGIPATPSKHKETSVPVEVASDELQQKQCTNSGIQATPLNHKETSVPVEITSDELQQRQSSNSGIRATQSNHKETSPSIAARRSLEDGYNWLKYGQKDIKGIELPRSYYKCSYPNCQVKKQLKRSHDGHVTEIIYKGKHDHAKPHPSNQMATDTIWILEEQSDRCSFSNSTEANSLSGCTSNHTKPNGTPGPSPVAASDSDVEGASAQLNRNHHEIEDGDDPGSKRRCLKFNTEITGNASVQEQDQCVSQTFVSASSMKNENALASSHKSTPPLTVPNPPVNKIKESIVPVEVDCDESQQRLGSDSRVQATRYNHKGSLSLVTERFCGDGYNWRKYGQKHIKGSEFLRSYYRCTHPNCPVKKQLEQSHDGQITEIVYKGKHDHPTPQPLAVGRILSFEDERSDVFSSLNSTEDKSSNGRDGLSPVTVSDDDTECEGSRSNRIGDDVEDDDPKSNHRGLKFNEETKRNADVGLNHQPCRSSLQIEVQSQSQALVFSPTVKYENIAAASHELTLPVPNPPVYMVTTRGIVPIEVDSDDLQGQGSDNGVHAMLLNHKGTNPSISLERLLENAYYWRKYGQKNIKGSEFPRSYYRCTHPNCQMRMQFVRSHDGRVIEIICRGKHDHPKPQPCSRLAVGAILSIHETSDIFSSLNNTENKSSNGHGQISLHAKRNVTSEPSLATVSDDDVEGAGGQSNRSGNEAGNDNDLEAKRRRKDIGGLDFTQFGRAIKETRVIVETVSESDVVDDGYRWCKYGRKMVRGNPYPRNYFRCSNTGCSVKKHVGRASHNSKVVIATYEGKHNHDQPAPRTTSHDTAGLILHNTASNGTLVSRSDESATISLDVGAGLGPSPENGFNIQQQTLDAEPAQSQSHIADPDCVQLIQADPVSAHEDDLNESVDEDRSRNDRGESFSFDTSTLNQSSSLNLENIESY